MGLIVPGQTEAIERVAALAKFTKGSAAAKLIIEATATPELFVFAELASCSNIIELKNSEFHSAFLLLEIFSFGTLKEYKGKLITTAFLNHPESRIELPSLSDAQLRKLKLLTLVDMATKRKLLPYSSLLASLEMYTVRELEDLIMESLFLGILAGKINQKEKTLEVTNVMARDVIPNKHLTLIDAFTKWDMECQRVIESIDSHIEETKLQKSIKLNTDAFLEKVSAVKKTDFIEKTARRKRTLDERAASGFTK